MVKYVKISFLFLAWLTIACTDDAISDNFFGYQVERLISTGDTALWEPIAITLNGESQLTRCEDSVYFQFILGEDDSLSVLELVPHCQSSNGLFDTLSEAIGRASVDDEVFTDSIVFADGGFLIINEIFSSSVVLTREDETLRLQLVAK